MSTPGPQRILSHGKNILAPVVPAVSSVRPSNNSARQTAFTGLGPDGQPQGRWKATLGGSYTGPADTLIDIRALAATGNVSLTEPVFVGAGGGTIESYSVTGTTAQDYRIQLTNFGIETVFAFLTFFGVRLVGKNAGVAANNLTLDVSQTVPPDVLLGPSTPEAATANQRRFVGDWEFGGFPLQLDGTLDPRTPRILFGANNPEVYYPYKVFEAAEGQWVNYLNYPLVRAVPKNIPIYQRTGTYTVAVSQGGPALEIYQNIITLYDFLIALKERDTLSGLSGSALIDVDGVVSPDRTVSTGVPGQSAIEFPLRTIAQILSSSATVSGDEFAVPLQGLTIAATTPTSSLEVVCKDNSIPQAEVWDVTLGGVTQLDATTNIPYTAGNVGFTVPTRPTPAVSQDVLAVINSNFSAKTSDASATNYPRTELRQYALGQAAKKKTFTFTWAPRPDDACNPNQVTINEPINTACITGPINVVATGGGSAVAGPINGNIAIPYAALMAWVDNISSPEMTTSINGNTITPDETEVFVRRYAQDWIVRYLDAASAQDLAASTAATQAVIGDLNTFINGLATDGFFSPMNPTGLPYGVLNVGGMQTHVEAYVKMKCDRAFTDNGFRIPFDSAGTTGTACWLDYGDTDWFVVTDNEGNEYDPAFINKPYIATQSGVTTDEMAVIVAISCPELVVYNDSFQVDLFGDNSIKAYTIGDHFDASFLGPMDNVLQNGVDGDDRMTWAVSAINGVNTIPMPNYTPEQNDALGITPQAYSLEGGGGQAIDFTIVNRVPPFEIGDEFRLSAVGQQFEFRQDAGAWTGPLPMSAQTLVDGITVDFTIGISPGPVAGDTINFAVEQFYAADHLQAPSDARFAVNGDTGTITYTLTAAAPLSAFSVLYHALPATFAATVEFRLGGALVPFALPSAPLVPITSTALAYTRDAMTVYLDQPITADQVTLTFSGAVAGVFRYLWAGEPIALNAQPSECYLNPVKQIAQSRVPNGRHVPLGRGHQGRIAYSAANGAASPPVQADINQLITLFDDEWDRVGVTSNFTQEPTVFARFANTVLPVRDPRWHNNLPDRNHGARALQVSADFEAIFQ